MVRLQAFIQVKCRFIFQHLGSSVRNVVFFKYPMFSDLYSDDLNKQAEPTLCFSINALNFDKLALWPNETYIYLPARRNVF